MLLSGLSITKCSVLPLIFSVSRPSACLISSKHSLLSTSISLHHATSPTQSFPQQEEKCGQLFNDDFTEFLVKECGLYNSQLPTIQTIHRKIKGPLSLQKFLHRARQVLQLFRDLGFTPHQVRTVIRKRPNLLLSEVDHLKPKINHLIALGLTREDLAMVITRKPRILSVSLEKNLDPKIRFLANLFGSEAHLPQVIKKAPNILLCDSIVTCDVVRKVKRMKDIGFREDEIENIFKKDPRLLCVTIETLDKRLKHVANLGLTDEEIKQVIVRRPSILLLSVVKMQKNMDFLINIAKFEPNIICSYSMFLIYSLEKRLKPRFMLYEYLNRSSEPLSISLAYMFAIRDEEFSCRFLSDIQTFKLYESYVRKSSDTALSAYRFGDNTHSYHARFIPPLHLTCLYSR